MTAQKLGDRYRLESEIAHGGMAIVYRAIDEVLDRVVAAKVLKEHLAEDSVLRERFRNEALAAARLTHPNIVSVFDTGEQDGIPFIVMEYLDGGTLRDQMSSSALEPGRVASIGADVCSALQFAHDAGVIHRDIKPANILFSESGLTKVGDFGIAKAAFADANLTDTGALLGTVRYLAPEQVEGVEPDGRADIYALGVVLYEAVTGRLPFKGETDLAMATARLVGMPPSPRDVRPGVPRDLDAAILRALATDRQQRFQSGDSFRRALMPHADEAGHHLVADRSFDQTQQIVLPPHASFVKSESRWLIWAVVLIALAAALVLGLPRITKVISGALTHRSTSDVQKISVVDAGTFDPDPGDGKENDDEVRFTFDGDPSTRWHTSSYKTDKFGGLKDGVGIWVDTGGAKKVQKIVVDSVGSGWEATVRTSEDAQSWSEPQPASESVGTHHDFLVQGTHRYWMIWVTLLARTPGQGTGATPYSVGIEEISVVG